MDRRVEELEVKLAFLEKQLLDLNEVVLEFADKATALEREVGLLRARLEEDALPGIGPEKPPHY
jgi:uncharacterized coiled-coil protein SlyX